MGKYTTVYGWEGGGLRGVFMCMSWKDGRRRYRGGGNRVRGGKGGAAPAIIFFPPLFPARKFAKVGGKDGGKKKIRGKGAFPPFLRRRRRHLLKAPRGRKRGETQAKKRGGDAHDLSHVHKPPSQQVFSSPFPSARLFPVTNFPPREGERQKRSEKMGTR